MRRAISERLGISGMKTVRDRGTRLDSRFHCNRQQRVPTRPNYQGHPAAPIRKITTIFLRPPVTKGIISSVPSTPRMSPVRTPLRECPNGIAELFPAARYLRKRAPPLFPSLFKGAFFMLKGGFPGLPWTCSIGPCSPLPVSSSWRCLPPARGFSSSSADCSSSPANARLNAFPNPPSPAPLQVLPLYPAWLWARARSPLPSPVGVVSLIERWFGSGPETAGINNGRKSPKIRIMSLSSLKIPPAACPSIPLAPTSTCTAISARNSASRRFH